MRLTYHDLANAILANKDFTCSTSIRAKHNAQHPEVYVVYSYDTPILIKFRDRYFINTQKYSHTTSRLQTILRALNLPNKELYESYNHFYWAFCQSLDNDMIVLF